jgi:hypothetical protein
MWRHPTGADMTPRFFENVSTWFADWNLIGMMPPRDPNDDDDDDDAEDEDDDEPDDGPAVVREPDE